jgi:hypothetical protein
MGAAQVETFRHSLAGGPRAVRPRRRTPARRRPLRYRPGARLRRQRLARMAGSADARVDAQVNTLAFRDRWILGVQRASSRRSLHHRPEASGRHLCVPTREQCRARRLDRVASRNSQLHVFGRSAQHQLLRLRGRHSHREARPCSLGKRSCDLLASCSGVREADPRLPCRGVDVLLPLRDCRHGTMCLHSRRRSGRRNELGDASPVFVG